MRTNKARVKLVCAAHGNKIVKMEGINTLNPNINFATVTIQFNLPITSIQSYQPCINIFSNSNFSSNLLSFNNITGLTLNTYYKWITIFKKPRLRLLVKR